ncbi:MAG: hypothetical protein ABTQ27_07145 [Amaricoccus sp.]|uniref:hypothetical protein n=1 Tax=Amaricoccus sp. TaxID=1872485 RepID=UPI003314A484
MRRSILTGLAMITGLTAAVLALPAQAQGLGNGWSGQFTLYGWIPSISGSQQGRDGEPLIDLDSQSILSALDGAFMGAAEFRKDKFTLLLDAVYADLSADGNWVQDRVKTSAGTQLGVYTVAAAYRVYELDRRAVDLYAGSRFFDTSLSFGIATDNRGVSRDADLSWADPIVGIRGTLPLSEKWSLSGFADVGGFDADTDMSWELFGAANYAFADRWAGVLGYRYMSILYEASDRAKLDLAVQGPVIGVTYKF